MYRRRFTLAEAELPGSQVVFLQQSSSFTPPPPPPLLCSNHCAPCTCFFHALPCLSHLLAGFQQQRRQA
eukprot:758315-Hanusia_phi.AAC.1